MRLPRKGDTVTFPAPAPTLDSMKLAARWGVSGLVAEYCASRDATCIEHEIRKRLDEIGALRDMLAVRVAEEAACNLGAALADVGSLWAFGELCWWVAPAAAAATTDFGLSTFAWRLRLLAAESTASSLISEYLRSGGSRDALLAAAAAGAMHHLLAERP